MLQREFKIRRQGLFRRLRYDDVLVVPAACEQPRCGDQNFPFRQNSDFYYLTGLIEPQAVAVFTFKNKKPQFMLFSKPANVAKVAMTGKLLGQKGARRSLGADQAFPIDKLDELLPGFLAEKQRVFYPIGDDAAFDERLLGWVKSLRVKARHGLQVPETFVHSGEILHEMRLLKSKVELEMTKKAVAITTGAVQKLMRLCRPGLMEYELEAELRHEFTRHGVRHMAFDPIIAGGANTCILHYMDNNQRLQTGDLLVVDVGAEYDYYAADVTRTFPVNGEFTAAQRAVYEAVLAVQLTVIKKVRPGVTWQRLQSIAEQETTTQLIKLGLLQGGLKTLLKREAFKPFFMHRIGHWLGLDAHDVGKYKEFNKWNKLAKGMVLAIEPGIYIPAKMKGVAKKWWNIGVRIEDDILVTANGCEILSRDLPKTVAEIEALMAQ